MYVDPRNPQLQKFQAEKAARKYRAIMRKEIATANPKLSAKQIEQVIDAKLALDAQQAERDQKAAYQDRRPHRNDRPNKPRPQIANQSLAIGLSNWLDAKK